MAGPGLLFDNTGDTSPTGMGTWRVFICLVLDSASGRSAGSSWALGRGLGGAMLWDTGKAQFIECFEFQQPVWYS